MTNINFSKREWKEVLISIILLGFLFSFTLWGTNTFDFLVGIGNWIRASLVAAVCLLVHIIVKKYIALKYGSEIEYRIWSLKNFKFAGLNKIPLIGVLLPLFLIFISNGNIIFAGIGVTILGTNTVLRLGRKFKHISEFENAMISLSGPLASLVLAMLFKIADLSGFTFDLFVKMNFYLAFFTMLPLPNYDGLKIFIASRFLYILTFAFIIITIILSQYVNIISTVILALILALAMAIIYFYFLHFK